MATIDGIDLLVPLLTLGAEEPDFSDADRAFEIQQLYDRNQAIQRCFYGQMSPSDLLDLLESHEIDPVEYVSMVEANIDLVIRSDMPLSF